MKITIELASKYDSDELQPLLEFLLTLNKNQKSNGKKKGKDWLEDMKPKTIDTEDVDIFEHLKQSVGYQDFIRDLKEIPKTPPSFPRIFGTYL